MSPCADGPVAIGVVGVYAVWIAARGVTQVHVVPEFVRYHACVQRGHALVTGIRGKSARSVEDTHIVSAGTIYDTNHEHLIY